MGVPQPLVWTEASEASAAGTKSISEVHRPAASAPSFPGGELANWALKCWVSFFHLLFKYLFTWLHGLLVVVRGIFQSSWRHAGMVACRLLVAERGIELGHLHWGCEVFVPGPPGKSHPWFLTMVF